MGKEQQEISGLEREVVLAVIESKAVDFEALGAAIAKFGPSAAMAMDSEDWFCTTMKWFVRFFRIPDPIGPIVRAQDLGQMREVIAPDLRR